ncbi:uncharacterized protein LOC107299618 [Protobothrops mucrosquamatus]|uniref:uncharacterized protein LOC107299618 n=1 Tax=Protobothrops mucrosquamatus TaxID=103944 RepID=UPI000775A140|nr:uncharacterized protein LOC107299618 [Protobothrops mucrosquamatus]
MQILAWLTCLYGLLGAGLSGRPHGSRNLPVERGCCKRQRRMVFLGHERPLGPGERPQERPSRGPARGRVPPHSDGCCPPGSRCQPTRLLVQDRWLRDGPRRVEVVEGCQCNASPDECLRSPLLKTFFPDSPSEQTLDVGSCTGPPPAQGGPVCVPTRLDSVVLQGPNGQRLVQTLGGCGWQGASCYRVPHWQHYSEVVLSAEGKKTEQRKEMDVGRCLGRCSLRVPGATGRGRARAPASLCVPDHYETKTFRSRTGQLSTIFAIRTCRCGAAVLPPLQRERR